MKTDAALIARLAGELDGLLKGARATGFALDGGGRAALRTERPERVVVFDAFAPTPLVVLGEAETVLRDEPGFTRAIASAIRGMRIGGVEAVPGERILRVAFVSRSRFGVVDGYEPVVELVPRFGNVLLLKGPTIVAAAKEFGLAENRHRAILVGGRYSPPPARPGGGASSLPPKAENAPESALEQLAGAARARDERDGSAAAEGKRLALERAIERRLSALETERDRLEGRREEALARDALARAGESLYAFSAQVPQGAERFTAPTGGAEITLDPALDAKANAARYFARYRKLQTSLPHLEGRLEHVESQRATLEELAWQLEGGDGGTLAEVSDALTQIEGPRKGAVQTARKRRAPLRYELPSGARIYVGRSPQENAEVTFKIARPADLWFHARALPGAHVILQSAPGREADLAELEWAAATAAFHSKAREAERVDIDYVARKYVRKQRNAPPGRVWYTNAQTLTVRPRDPATP